MLRTNATTLQKANQISRSICYGLPDTGYLLAPYSGRSVAFLSLWGRCYDTVKEPYVVMRAVTRALSPTRLLLFCFLNWQRDLRLRSVARPVVTSNHVISAHRKSPVSNSIRTRTRCGKQVGSHTGEGGHLAALDRGRMPGWARKRSRFVLVRFSGTFAASPENPSALLFWVLPVPQSHESAL